MLASGGYLGVVIVGSFVGYICSAYLGDAIGRRRAFFAFAVGSAAIAIGYTQFQISNGLMLVLGFPLGFFASGIFSNMGPLLSELFPTELRGTGQGFCYNFGRGLAAFFPFFVGWASKVMPLGEAIGLIATCAYGVVILAAMMLPETAGRALTSLADNAVVSTTSHR